jgi:hypothetical protein
MGANAFALPGGTVVVTDQLLELSPDDAALAGVLAHEIGHVEHRHLMRQLISGTVVGVVATLLAGDTSSVMVALPAVLADLSYSRADASRYRGSSRGNTRRAAIRPYCGGSTTRCAGSAVSSGPARASDLR